MFIKLRGYSKCSLFFIAQNKFIQQKYLIRARECRGHIKVYIYKRDNSKEIRKEKECKSVGS